MAVAVHSVKGAPEKKKITAKQRRVAVTGMGVVISLGHDSDTFYNNLLQRKSGVSEIESFDYKEFPTRIAGEIKSFSTDVWVAPKLSKRMDKFMLYMLTAGKKALLLEELEHAKKRGATIYAEFLGGSSTSDAYHMTEPHPEGTGVLLCIEKALDQVGISKESVNYVNAHATSTKAGDLQGVQGLDPLFWQYRY